MRSGATPGTAPVQDFLDMMLVNAFSPVRLIEIFEDIVAPNGTIAAMSFTVEERIPLVADMLEKNHGKAGLRYVDRFDKTLPR